MNSVPYVSEKALEVARWMERRLAEVNKMAGFLFVSVKAVPAPKGLVNAFEVRIGIDKKMEEDTGVAVVKHTFDELIKGGAVSISVAVYRGIRGAASSSDNEEASPNPS
jgi:hypothetical protein